MMGNENPSLTRTLKRKAPPTYPKLAKKAHAAARSDSMEPEFADVNTLLVRAPTLGELLTTSKKERSTLHLRRLSVIR